MTGFWRVRRLRRDDVAEERLIEAARSGNREAFDALMQRYENRLRGFLFSRVGPDPLEDVLQETRVACWLALPRYTGSARFAAWMLGIAFHKCADHFRSNRNALHHLSLDDTLVAQRPDPTDAYDAADNRMLVYTFLQSLPEPQREVMELYYYGRLTLAEVSEVLSRSPNTVKSQFYRAHARAAEQMASLSPAPDFETDPFLWKGAIIP